MKDVCNRKIGEMYLTAGRVSLRRSNVRSLLMTIVYNYYIHDYYKLDTCYVG